MSSHPPSELLKFDFTHRATAHALELPSSATLADLRSRISEATGVPTSHLKLLPRALKGVDLNAKDVERTLEDAGLTGAASPVRMLVLGATAEEVSREEKAVEEKAKREGPRHYHPSMLRGTQPRRTGSNASSSTSPFLSIVPHAGTPPASAQGKAVIAYLRRLADDPGVAHVCALHGFKVGVLTELLPHEHPELLGLNENMGQRISLRIRTDTGDGMRSYRDARKVLLHELAHNKVNDHPPEFKELNSLLNAQLEAHERAAAEGTHRLVSGDVYEPVAREDAAAQTSFVLGGGSNVAGDSIEERRRAVLQATMKRLEARELEIEKACGAGGNGGGGGTQPAAS